MPTYQELLQDPLWQKKRKQVIERDKHCCQKCYNLGFVEGMSKGLVIYWQSSGVRCVAHLMRIGSKQRLLRAIEENGMYPAPCLVYFPEGEKRLYAIRRLTKNELDSLSFPKSPRISTQSSFTELQNQVRQYMTTVTQASSRFAEHFQEGAFTSYTWLYSRGLHVHHTYYQEEKLPWEYLDEAFLTLCFLCHEELHQNEQIPVYDAQLRNIGYYHYCLRCHGAGSFPEYHHVQAGICFRCNGARYEELIET